MVLVKKSRKQSKLSIQPVQPPFAPTVSRRLPPSVLSIEEPQVEEVVYKESEPAPSLRYSQSSLLSSSSSVKHGPELPHVISKHAPLVVSSAKEDLVDPLQSTPTKVLKRKPVSSAAKTDVINENITGSSNKLGDRPPHPLFFPILGIFLAYVASNLIWPDISWIFMLLFPTMIIIGSQLWSRSGK
ncbi:hypothetical protein NEOLI_004047 [Neolecta irregularis DAH-3]|uniref:Uncharacterized protein n=1 Tax=Neolecta irregularis (strain DAH-3) TaxID=1198029 RepID=A0A1U7LI44_NEOID|nr:hypothetical protein NEOLI_004047 [Neolecta irregularis DAH-3]|eukprot:OLL22314.1 hypothetical protein NEOLI_004047 [Neolecta irregularis DAH-3]